jgi:DHA3 family macrolide efflux protein-like MFS transporter
MEMDATASPAPVAAAPAAPVPLLNRNFLLLWSGQTVSQLGNQAYGLAMTFWLMEKTGSASLMGLVMMFSSLPALLLSPFGGAFADRHSRIRIIIVCNLVAGFLLTAMTAAMWLIPERVQLLVAGFFVTATLLGLNRSFFMPAVSATMPDLVPKEKLVAANSMNQLSVQASLSVGQLIGGILYRVVGAPVLFLIDAISFFLAAGNASLIRIKERKRELGPERTAQEVFRAYKADLAEGFRFVWKYKGFRYFLAAASLMNFFMMPVVVLFPFYVSRYLGKGSEWYGFLMASLSVGTICGFLLASTLRLKGPARAWTILIGMLIAPGLYGSLGFVAIPYVALAGCFGFGLTMGIVNVNLMTIAQTSTPPELRGRVMGLMAALGGGLAPIGMALGGFMGDLTGKNVPLVYGICGVLTVIVILATCFRRDTLDYLAWGRRDQTGAAA